VTICPDGSSKYSRLRGGRPVTASHALTSTAAVTPGSTAASAASLARAAPSRPRCGGNSYQVVRRRSAPLSGMPPAERDEVSKELRHIVGGKRDLSRIRDDCAQIANPAQIRRSRPASTAPPFSNSSRRRVSEVPDRRPRGPSPCRPRAESAAAQNRDRSTRLRRGQRSLTRRSVARLEAAAGQPQGSGRSHRLSGSA
jgi:hypothetical protein